LKKPTIKPRYLGVFFILLAAFCFALMGAFVKLAGDLPSMEKSFFRNIVALLFATATMLKQKESFRVEKKSILPLFCRSFFGTVGLVCNFYAIDHLVLSDASMLNKLSPFFAILASVFLLKERLSLVQGVSVVVAFSGSLFILKPSFSGLQDPAALVGLLGGFGAGIAYTCVRKLGLQGMKGSKIVFYFSLFSTLVTLPLMLTDFKPMTLWQLLALVAAGFSACGGQFAITAAYRHAPAKEISVYDYSQIVFSALLGLLLFGQLPDGWSFLGYLIIIGTAVWMFWYNNRKPSSKKKGIESL
jgi:drug/metabolite transporter (DMT)-like permease